MLCQSYGLLPELCLREKKKKYTAIICFIIKEERTEINELKLYFRKLIKVQQKKPHKN